MTAPEEIISKCLSSQPIIPFLVVSRTIRIDAHPWELMSYRYSCGLGFLDPGSGRTETDQETALVRHVGEVTR